MYVLSLLKDSGIMERKVGSRIMCMTVDKMFPIGTVLPIVIENYIVSEAKVVDSNIFSSRIKIVLINDSNVIPQFEVYDDSDMKLEIEKHSNMGTTESMIKQMGESLSKIAFKDVRPCSISMLKLLIPDLLDYSGLKNLQLNVRFKT